MDSYYLADTRASAVQPPGRFTVLAMQAQRTISNRLQAYFEIVLTPTANSLRATPLDVIYALGALSGTDLQVRQICNGQRYSPVMQVKITRFVRPRTSLPHDVND